MAKVTIVFHSGFGHTAKLAQAVHEGAAGVAGADVTTLPITPEGELPPGGWDTLAAADAIVFGSPTYMGGPTWQFKKFADTSSKQWAAQAWKDKVGAGFTNSAAMNGDKFSTVNYFVTLAMQQSMLWVGLGLMPANAKANSHQDVNYVGGFGGAYATSPSDSGPDEYPTTPTAKQRRCSGGGWPRWR